MPASTVEGEAVEEIHRDAILEIVNVAIGRAAAALSEMVDDQIELTVPALSFLDRNQTTDRLNLMTGKQATAVSQRFSGTIAGDALLVFPERQSLELVRTLLRDETDLDTLTELEQDALKEVGNVILNTVLSSFSNQLGADLDANLPEITSGSNEEILDLAHAPKAGEPLIMFIEVAFEVEGANIQGYVVIVLDVGAGRELTQLIDAYLAGLTA
ncbi:MAG: chemotaxis protein CheX [Alphaproteobacteria bacterium]|jgi:chemotaxis protein CheC|nr:chemotaxis protein CheC [Rhodospirillaceae bacterium]MDP6403783.1 chemotaxis protein CheX [Alphaproteobacteria bacterium]MDP6620640.1 chemotaxis protein CheX [Alphaproteobacteria bacterium]|tara:strand:+ start:248 stop:889 length:642 start_codon:yes stop_codon:yes gene_type:complete